MMQRPLMTKSIRYGLRAVMTYGRGADNPLEGHELVKFAASHSHSHLSNHEISRNPRDFLQELLGPHNPGLERLPREEWENLSSKEILERSPYPGIILAVNLHDHGANGARLSLESDRPCGGEHIGWAYTPRDTHPPGATPPDSAAAAAARSRIRQTMSELEQFLNGQAFKISLEENYQVSPVIVGELYNHVTQADPETGLSTAIAQPGYPDENVLNEALTDLELSQEDLEQAGRHEWIHHN